MRISDWSSDVCSSDLVGRDQHAAMHRRRNAAGVGLAGRVVGDGRRGDAVLRIVVAAVIGALEFQDLVAAGEGARQARKSVVSGKSVSVSVDLGGRRIITKNKLTIKIQLRYRYI